MILNLVSRIDQLVILAYERVSYFSPLHFVLFDILLVVLVVKIFRLFCSNEAKLVGFKSNKETLASIKKQLQDVSFAGKSIGKGMNLAAGTQGVDREVEKLLEKVKEVQEMHSNFQTEVIESHIHILKILAPGDSNFLMPPERELVEPDSALPPLDENEEDVDFV